MRVFLYVLSIKFQFSPFDIDNFRGKNRGKFIAKSFKLLFYLHNSTPLISTKRLFQAVPRSTLTRINSMSYAGFLYLSSG